jgi:hypothetical protein
MSNDDIQRLNNLFDSIPELTNLDVISKPNTIISSKILEIPCDLGELKDLICDDITLQELNFDESSSGGVKNFIKVERTINGVVNKEIYVSLEDVNLKLKEIQDEMINLYSLVARFKFSLRG